MLLNSLLNKERILEHRKKLNYHHQCQKFIQIYVCIYNESDKKYKSVKNMKVKMLCWFYKLTLVGLSFHFSLLGYYVFK